MILNFLKKELDKNAGQGKFIVSSEDKSIIFTDLGNKSNIIDFQEKPYEENIYNEALEKLINHLSEEVNDKYQKMEQLYLDFT